MINIKIYKYKDEYTLKMPIGINRVEIDDLNELMLIDIVDTEVVFEYTVLVPNDFLFENYAIHQLEKYCSLSNNCVEHHFVTVVNNEESNNNILN